MGTPSVFSDRLDCFGARPGHQDDWAALVAEGLSHLVAEVLSILIGEEILAIDEQNKSRRSGPHLGGVKEF